eukprot:355845_1
MSSRLETRQPPTQLAMIMNSSHHSTNLPYIRRNICKTLQGHIHLIQDPNTKELLIVKQTIKALVSKGICHQGTKIQENFLEEQRILSYLSKQSDYSNKGICGIHNDYQWSDQYSYYYAMKYCKCDLFDFVRQQWTYFANNPKMKRIMLFHATKTMPYQPWIDTIQVMFRQIVTSVDYLHSKGIAHLDLSLENIMLGNTTDIKTQIIDFGVAYDISQNNGSWKTSKRVGKYRYMAPEVAADGVVYDARSADVWSLGVVLFTMLTGSAPYKKPVIVQDLNDKHSSGDIVLTYLLNGQIDAILRKQKKRWMVSDDALDLMKRIFRLERRRIQMEEVLRHPFVGLINTSKNAI